MEQEKIKEYSSQHVLWLVVHHRLLKEKAGWRKGVGEGEREMEMRPEEVAQSRLAVASFSHKSGVHA